MTGSLLSTKTVAIYGMGYVGLTLALALNEKKIEVIGIDTNQKVVEDLIRGITDIQEPYIEKKLSHSLSEGLLKVTKSINSETAKNVDVFIVTVGTPILDSRINDEAVVEVTSEIGRIMRDGSLVILRSTLEIGTTRNKIFPILNKTGKTFFLAMCPERTIEGNAIEEIAILPQVIGGINETSSDKAEKFFLSFCREVITIHNPESAELIKLANNTYRDLSFGFANELSKLCGSLGLNSREVINAANYGYPRSNIALPGQSGGPCLTKDPWILFESGKKYDVEMPITKASREVNENYVRNFLETNLSEIEIHKLAKVSCLGLSFKSRPKTRDTRGAAIHEVLKYFELNRVNNVYGYEPAGKVKLPNILQANDLYECLRNAELILILNALEDAHEVATLIRNFASPHALVLDLWNSISPKILEPTQTLKVW